jgi:uncharacterized DUF497 family protein
VAAAGCPALFVSRNGTRLSMRMIQLRLARWAKKAGLGAHVHPHMLRHSFASHVLQSSGDLRAVQEMLGHSSIGTTQVYTHLDFMHLAKVYDAAHPRAKKKSYGEQRFVTLGLLAGIPVSIVHTENENEIRIISFRNATRRETQIYFDEIKN